MVKGITIVRPAGTPESYARLASFFSALGFEAGRGWEEELSRGVSFLAPLGNLEFADGIESVPAEILIEVTGLEAVETVARDWMIRSWLSPVTETNWKTRLFTVEPAPGHSIAFWEWDDPHKGRPVAVEGDLSAHGMRFAVVVARWNSVITDRLLQGALDGLYRSGAARRDVQVIRVPGAWEMITLGVLLRGETAHYEAIYNEVSRGIGQSQQETGIPHAFGVLTCETLEQALNRAGIKAGNKGFEAAMAAIEMVSLERKMSQQTPAVGQNHVHLP
jgi:6,7-dimethyl-8-ribityllumazine synthase